MTGIAHATDGKALNLFGDGKVEVASKNVIEITYGSNTELTVGLSSDYKIGLSTEVTVGTSMEATLAVAYKKAKEGELEVAPSGEFIYEDLYVGTVGADATHATAAKVLKYAMDCLLAVQTAAMVACATAATVYRVKDSETIVGNEVPEDFGQPIEMAMRIVNATAMVTPMVLLAFKKWQKIGHNSSPAGVLALDALNGVFLGRRQPVGLASSGVLMNDVCVQISAADSDLGYNHPNATTSIIGFQNAAGDPATGGSRLEVGADGGTGVYGKSFKLDLVSSLQVPPASFTANAQSHSLVVTTAGSLTPAGPALNLTDQGSELKYDTSNVVAVRNGTVTATAGNAGQTSVMRLTASEASIGAGGVNLTVSASGLILSFSPQQQLRIDATGFALGDAVTVLQPGPPALTFASIEQAKLDIASLEAATSVLNTQATVANEKFKTAFRILQNLNGRLIDTRARLENIADGIPD